MDKSDAINRLPQNKAEEARIHTATAKLLKAVPDVWSAFDRDRLTSTEQRALDLMVIGNLVELRGQFRATIVGSPDHMEFRVWSGGAHGIIEAFGPVFQKMNELWPEAFAKYQESGGVALPFVYMKSGPSEWRLTEYGIDARDCMDAEPEKKQDALTFVTRTGCHTGEPLPTGGGGHEFLSISRTSATVDAHVVSLSPEAIAQLMAGCADPENHEQAVLPEFTDVAPIPDWKTVNNIESGSDWNRKTKLWGVVRIKGTRKVKFPWESVAKYHIKVPRAADNRRAK